MDWLSDLGDSYQYMANTNWVQEYGPQGELLINTKKAMGETYCLNIPFVSEKNNKWYIFNYQMLQFLYDK